MGKTRSPERWQFLGDLFTTAIENYGYGWFETKEYHWFNSDIDDEYPHNEWYAVIVAEDTEEEYFITPETFATGLGKWGKNMPKALAEANRTNGEDGDYDVIDALNVLEYALFNEIRYS